MVTHSRANSLLRSVFFQRLILALLFPGLACFSTSSFANPSGGVVVHGGVEIGDGLNGHLSILQSTDKAIINWAEFSIQAGETTQFVQPGASSAVLNRVVSGSPTAIHGALKANGKVFVINPNGILVGPSGRIDVGGLVLSTLDVSDADFLGGGDMLFTGNSSAGVKNMGRVNAIGGDVFLIGKTVENTGTITASQGTIGLAAGSEVLIAANPDATGQRVFVRAGTSGHSIDNSGTLEAAAVELKAHGNAYALAINNSGSIRATGVDNRGGRVFLSAPGGRIDNSGSIAATLPNGDGGRIFIEGGLLNLGGTIDASGSGNGDGGTIEVLGEEVNVTGSVLANGKNGGTISVTGPNGEAANSVTVAGGGVISANGTSGAGGTINVLANNVVTEANSLISATGYSSNGGSVRITGTQSSSIAGAINVGSVEGIGGTAIVEGANVELGATASIDASGGAGGGDVRAGGGFGGNNELISNAETTQVAAGAQVIVDAINTGDAGTAVIWADGNTIYRGEISAQARGAVGNGGYVEVSGKRHLVFDGSSNQLAAGNGENGTLLLDPANIEITNGSAQEDPTASLITRGQINTQLGLGHVVIATTVADAAEDGNILISDRVDFSRTNNLALLATGDIVFRSRNGNQSRLRNTNANSGDITLVAGWDGVTGAPGAGNNVNANGMFRPEDPGAAPFEGNAASYGNAGANGSTGSIIIDSGAAANNDRIYIGARDGATSLFGNNLTMTGGADNRGVIIGDWGTATQEGNIRVKLDGDLTMTGGTGNGAFIQIGHGGDNRRGAANKVGDIDVDALGAITMTSGSGTRSYTQIGHGGSRSGFDLLDGDVFVTAGGDISMTSGTGGDVGAASQIGHGGRASGDWGPQNDTGDKLGDVEVVSTGGSVTMQVNRRHYVQIGHGGRESRSDEMGGNVTVRALGGDISMIGNTSAADNDGYSMIGNGGHAATTAQGNFGDITVEASGAISVAGGAGNGNFAQIGNGGRSNRSGSTNGHRGDIDVSAGTGITFTAGTYGVAGNNTDGQNYVQLGHGGYDADASIDNNYVAGNGHSGDIQVSTTTGDISFFGGSTANGSAGSDEGRIHYAMLGHGGVAALGDHEGAVHVSAAAGDVVFTGGAQTNDNSTDKYNFAMLGHGGAGGNWGNSTNTSGRLSANSVGGTLGLADGIHVTAGNAVNFTGGSGRRSFAQLGLGGYSSRGVQDGATDHQGDIFVTSGSGGVNFSGGTNTIGDAVDGTNDNNDGRDAYAQLGHGGMESPGTYLGDITVTTTGGGNVVFSGGNRADTYAQMGHGGRSSRSGTPGTAAGNSGDITVNSDGTLEVIAGTLFEPAGGNENGRIYAMVGHGGYDSDVFGDNTYVAGLGHNGDITITTGGLVSVIAGSTANGSAGGGAGREHFAQIGHGGIATGGDHAGSVNINAGGAVSVLGGTTEDNDNGHHNHALIGHGGSAGTNWGVRGGDLNANSLDGNTDGVNVTSGGDVTVTAGDTWSLAQIGLGGARYIGDFTGDVSVEATGDILLNGGTGNVAGSPNIGGGPTFAQIGLGGYESRGNHTGNVHVGSDGAVNLTSGIGNTAYTQIGHGGREVDGNHTGDICVHAATGVALTAGTTRQYGFSHIGHGGYSSSGTHSGFVTVTNSTSGDIALTGGSGANDQTAQIGHGGISNGAGALSGSISVVNLGGGVSVTAGNGNWRGAIIGHGDAQESNEGGTRTGGLNVYATGAITMTDGGGNSGAYISHQTNAGVGSVDYSGSGVQAAGDGGYSLVGLGGITMGNDQTVGQGNAIAFADTVIDALPTGDVAIVGLEDIILTPTTPTNIALNNDFDLTLAATRHLTVGFGYQQAGTGNVTLIGGWNGDASDGVAPTMAVAPLALGTFCLPDFDNSPISFAVDCDDLGANNGMVTIGNVAQTNQIGVGSRQGTTRVFGYGLVMNASTSTVGGHTQVGFRSNGAGNVTGAIDVRMKQGDITLNSGAFDDTFTQIGHGGTGAAADTITNTADVTISFCETGDVVLNASTGIGSYSQIGNGHSNVSAQTNGDVIVENFGNITMNGGSADNAYTQIGVGGNNSDGNKNANVTITGATTVADQGNITMNGGSANDTYAQIGNGGRNVNNNKYGDIEITNVVNVDMNGGSGNDASVHIGNGGNDSANGPVRGAIDITISGDLTLNAGSEDQAYAQVGHGGHSQVNGVMQDNGLSDISISTGGFIEVIGTTAGTPGSNLAPQAYSQIGHGGRGARGSTAGATTRERFGDITIVASGTNAAGNAITLTGGNSNESYVQIGHGGREADSYYKGDIDIDAAGNIEVQAGNRSRTYAMIGHGGDESEKTNDTIGAGGLGSLNGNEGAIDITTTNGGNLLVQGSQATTGNGTDHIDSNAMVGHGGHGTFGDHSGEINVNVAGGVTVQGGVNSDNNDERNYAQIGHGGENADGTHSGAVTVNAQTDIVVNGGAGSDSYGQIGHGGKNAAGNKTGAVTVNAGGNIGMTAGSTRSYSQIGHGGHEADGDESGAIDVDAGGTITGVGGSGGEAFLQIGHGGFRNSGIKDGAIDVDAGGNITMTSGASGNQTTTHIGHGGHEAAGDKSGAIHVESTGGAVVMAAGSAPAATWETSSTIGHGGVRADGISSGNIEVLADANVELRGGTNRGASAQIGHGVREERGGGNTGNVLVDAGGDVLLISGTGDRAYTQIGHGGENADGSHTGDVTVEAIGDVQLAGSTSTTSFSQIGHGGHNTTGDFTGNIHLGAGGEVELLSGAGNTAYTQVGHGGRDADGNHTGDICVHADTGVTVNAASGAQYGFSIIGHGGYSSPGTHSGFVTVTNATSGNIAVTGGAGANDRTAQIGHGGISNDDNALSGSISIVNLGGDVTVTGGDGDWRGAIIGHGNAQETRFAQGARTGGLNVFASGDVTMTDGAGNSGAYISHQTETGVGVVSYAGSGVQAAGDSGYSVVAGGNVTYSPDQLNGPNAAISLAETLGAASATGGGATIATQGDLDLAGLGGNTYFNGAGDINLLAGGDLDLGFGLQNQGAGDINLGAGYNFAANPIAAPTMAGAHNAAIALGTFCLPDYNPPIPLPANCVDFGVANAGTITLGSVGQTAGMSVGSRLGETNASSHELILNASNGSASGFTQLGYRGDGTGAISGAVNVFAHEGGVTLNSGAAADAFTLIGHGGTGASDDASTGPITISFCETGDLVLNGGGAGGTDSYAQVGSGVAGGAAAQGGAINVANFGDIEINGGAADGTQAQIGHGATGDSSAKSGGISLVGTGNIDLNGGAGADSSAQIGHGGTDSDGTKDGAIAVTAAQIILDGGTGTDSNAQIGSGGTGGSGDVTGAIDVIVTTSNLALQSGSGDGATSQVGHAGNSYAGNVADQDITIDVQTGGLVLNGGNGDSASSQVGHGGVGASGAMGGDIDIDTSNATVLNSGLAADSAAQIGHGGHSSFGNFGAGETIDVNSSAVILTSTGSYTQIGSGGANALATTDNVVNVLARGGDVVVDASGGAAAAYSKIGNGGNGVTGAAAGDVTVEANENALGAGGNVTVSGGTAQFASAQIGNGGGAADGNVTGHIIVDAEADVALTAPGAALGAFSKIGHGDDLEGAFLGFASSGTRDGDIQVTAGNDVTLENSMIGHVNKATLTAGTATYDSGSTYVAASRDNPIDGAGVIQSDSVSEFTSADELRFYIPRRANNLVAAGTLLNCAPFLGAEVDATFEQRADEFTLHILGEGNFPASDPLEHNNLSPQAQTNVNNGGPLVNDSGNYSTALGNYSFYYDTIVLKIRPPVVVGEAPVEEVVELIPDPIEGPDFLEFLLDDTLFDDENRNRFRRINAYKKWLVLYEIQEGYEDTHTYLLDRDGNPVFTGFFLSDNSDLETDILLAEVESLEQRLRDLNTDSGLAGTEEAEKEEQSDPEETAATEDAVADPFGAE